MTVALSEPKGERNTAYFPPLIGAFLSALTVSCEDKSGSTEGHLITTVLVALEGYDQTIDIIHVYGLPLIVVSTRRNE